MNVTALDRINYLNIGLMLVCCVIAIIVPFEMFLFAYAVLGPLHYLTEISWLHDKQYYAKRKYDSILLVVLGVLITIPILAPMIGISSDITGKDVNKYIYLAVIASVIFALTKSHYLRIGGILLAIVTLKLADNFYLFLSVFLPTLIHVFVFTALFVLYGALKTRSKSGYLSFVVMVLCPVILFYVFPQSINGAYSDYSRESYKSFEAINYFSLKELFHVEMLKDNMVNHIYFSKTGILLMRFIAFAYTYHYLNWFSKTRVIKWHEVPKKRLSVIVALWLTSIALYAYDYKIGFSCLFLLSFLHVLLELPLNVVSIKGIFQESKLILEGK